MSFFEDALRRAMPTAEQAKPIAIAVGGLILGRMLGTNSSAAGQPAAPTAPNASAGNVVGGLGGLISALENHGLGDVVSSWIGNGQNIPIDASQLGAALGSQTISALARHAGMNEQDLLNQLSQVLPGLVDHLTPQGRVPTTDEVARHA